MAELASETNERLRGSGVDGLPLVDDNTEQGRNWPRAGSNPVCQHLKARLAHIEQRC